MCYSPIRLVNNTRHFNEKTDKVYRSVPCGHCGECRTKQQQSFESRVYYEYLDTESRDGFTFFQTFTYNEENVPRHFGIRTFSRSDIRDFTLSFHHFMRKDRYKDISFKYFITCEYGGITYRPHYHALFFVVGDISVEEFAKITEILWDKGFCDTNNPDPTKRHTPLERVVNAEGALSYVSKYVCKDFDFERMLDGQEEMTDAHLTIPRELIPECTLKEIRPFHRQSNGLGLCMKDMISDHDLLDGKVKIPDSLQGTKYVSLPQYIDRKVFYDYNPEDKCFRLNDSGLEMKAHRDKYNRSYVKQSLSFIFDNFEQLWKCNPSYCQKKSHFDSWSDAKLFVWSQMAGRSFDQLALYIQHYKDLILPEDISSYSEDDLEKYAQHTALLSRIGSDSSQRLVVGKEDNSYLEKIRKKVRFKVDSLLQASYNNSPFVGFEEVISIFNIVNAGYCKASQELYIQDQIDKGRQKYVHSLYR